VTENLTPEEHVDRIRRHKPSDVASLAAFLALTVGATLALAALTVGATRVAIAALLTGTSAAVVLALIVADHGGDL
jgi:hypothetical protein